MDYDNYLFNLADEYSRECVPEYDGDGDPVNCLECENRSDCYYFNEEL